MFEGKHTTQCGTLNHKDTDKEGDHFICDGLRLVMFLLHFGLPFTEDHNFLDAFLQARAVENDKRRQDDLRAGKSDQQPSGPAKENRYTDGIPIDERQNDNKTFKDMVRMVNHLELGEDFAHELGFKWFDHERNNGIVAGALLPGDSQPYRNCRCWGHIYIYMVRSSATTNSPATMEIVSGGKPAQNIIMRPAT